jgi:hypothetical protein
MGMAILVSVRARGASHGRPVLGLAALAALAACALVGLTGCGGAKDPQVASAASGRPVVTTTAPAANEVSAYIEAMRAWANCLRGEGIEVTDPDPTGQVTFPGDPAALKADPKFLAAQTKCKSLQPPVPESVLHLRQPKLTAAQIDEMRQYARCMQQNGAPDFPDPGADGYPARGATTWNQTSAGAQKATQACAHIIGDPTSQPTTRG